MFTLGVLVLGENKMGPACSQRWGKLGCKMGCKMGPSWAPSCASWAGFLSLFSLRPVAAHHRGTSRWLRFLVVVVLLRVGVPNLGGSLANLASPIGTPIGPLTRAAAVGGGWMLRVLHRHACSAVVSLGLVVLRVP